MICTQHLKTKTALLALCILVLSYGTIPQTTAAVLWSDNFNDNNYNGWTVKTGAFTTADSTLRCTSITLSAIHHSSTVATGTWSIDFVFSGAIHVAAVYFAVGAINDIMGDQGYQVTIHNYGVTLYEVTDTATHLLDSYTASTTLQGRQSIDITRDIGGLFRVYVNDSLVMEATNTVHTTINYFLLHMYEDDSVDNIVVSNTVDVTPSTTDPDTNTPTDTPPAIPGFPAAAIIIGLVLSVLLVIVIRRRQPSTQAKAPILPIVCSDSVAADGKHILNTMGN